MEPLRQSLQHFCSSERQVSGTNKTTDFVSFVAGEAQRLGADLSVPREQLSAALSGVVQALRIQEADDQ